MKKHIFEIYKKYYGIELSEKQVDELIPILRDFTIKLNSEIIDLCKTIANIPL